MLLLTLWKNLASAEVGECWSYDKYIYHVKYMYIIAIIHPLW